MSTLKVDKLQGTSGSTTGLTFSGANGTFGGTLAVTGAVTASDDMNFNSGYGSAATAYGCRAWVNFNGTGTVAIRESGNVSSLTDNGVGDYTGNFASAIVDANYAMTSSGVRDSNSNGAFLYYGGTAPTTNAVRIWTGTGHITGTTGGVARDDTYVLVSITR